MPDLDPPPSPRLTMFAEPTPERAFPTTAVAIAAAAILILVAVLVLLARRHTPALAPNAALPAAAYAPNLIFTDLHMSDATSGSGGHLIYLEGRVANRGPSIVTGVTLQVTFANDVAMPAQIETTPLSLVYMREPYVDTHPVGAAPMAPGAESDFRLIFDNVNDNWNQQLPHLNAVQIATKESTAHPHT